MNLNPFKKPPTLREQSDTAQTKLAFTQQSLRDAESATAACRTTITNSKQRLDEALDDAEEQSAKNTWRDARKALPGLESKVIQLQEEVRTAEAVFLRIRDDVAAEQRAADADKHSDLLDQFVSGVLQSERDYLALGEHERHMLDRWQSHVTLADGRVLEHFRSSQALHGWARQIFKVGGELQALKRVAVAMRPDLLPKDDPERVRHEQMAEREAAVNARLRHSTIKIVS